MATLQLIDVSRHFPNGWVGVSELNLSVASGEFLVLVGPSGCGKTTTLRLIAGLDQPTFGTIRIGEREVNAIPPWDRGVAMVFQRPALYPTRTVRDNLHLGDALQKGRRWFPFRKNRTSEVEVRVGEIADLLNLTALLDRFPQELSGGEQQRVALGRALVRRPDILLMDEPLGHLDWRLRQDLLRQLPLLQKRLAATIIYVTHDPEEAASLAGRVALLYAGKLEQQGTLEELRQHPASPQVAEFLQPFSLQGQEKT